MFNVNVKKNDAGGRTYSLICNIAEALKSTHDNFYQYYKPIVVFVAHESFCEKRKLNFKKCRFCKKAPPEVTSKKLAHIIPKSCGNKNIMSEEECDTCNKLFGTYESDFIYFLGANNALYNDTKKFRGPDRTALYWEKQSEVKKVLNLDLPIEDLKITTKDAKEILSIKYRKNAYTPMNVYNTLLKIALSLLPYNLVETYNELFSFLLDNYGYNYDPVSQQLYQVIEHRIPGPPLMIPRVIIYEKKDPESRCLSHTACIYMFNYMFQILLPINRNDDWMFDNVTPIHLHFAPPLLTEEYVKKHGLPIRRSLIVNTKEKSIREVDQFSISFPLDKPNMDFVINSNK